MTKPIPSLELLRKLLLYEPDTGKLFWRERPVEMFSDGGTGADANCVRWNARYACDQAFTSTNDAGYHAGRIFGKSYYAHRVIWAMHTGAWPEYEIDHINHDRLDNRIMNLREATRQENSRNQSMPTTNKSGVIGVYWDKINGKWLAQIKVDGVGKHLGLFTSKSDAIAARAAADVEYGFHHNHGRAAS